MHTFEQYFGNTACLKDINFLNLLSDEVVMKMNKYSAKRLSRQLFKDVVLLNTFGLMDYSLLFVIAFNPKYVKLHPDKFAHIGDDEEGVLVENMNEIKKPYNLKESHSEKIELLKENLKFTDEAKAQRGRYGLHLYDIYPWMTQKERNFVVYMSGYT